MAETVTNLKVRFGADTKNFKADLESGKAAVDKFTGEAKDAFSEFASVFGINMNEVSAKFSSVQKSLSLISGGLKGTTDGLKGTTEAVRIFGVSWKVALGPIALVIVVIGSLVTALTRFSDNAEKVKVVMAGIGGGIDVLLDRFAKFGSAIIDVFSGDFVGAAQKFKETFTGIGAELENDIRLTAMLKRATLDLERESKVFDAQREAGMTKILQLREREKDQTLSATERLKANAEANKIEQTLAERSLELADQETAATLDNIDAQTKKLRLSQEAIVLIEKIKNGTIGAMEAQKAADELDLGDKDGKESLFALVDAIVKREKEQQEILQTRLRLQKSENTLKNEILKQEIDGLNSLASLKQQQSQNDKKTDLERTKLILEASELQKKALRIDFDANNISKEKYLAELDKLAIETEEKIKAIREKLNPKMETLSAIKLTVDDKTGKIAQTEIPAPKIGELETSKLEAKAAKIQSIYGNLKSTVVDFSSVFQESMTGLAVGFAESLGTMLTGATGFGDLAAMAGAALGDMAIQVGKIAIQTGIASLAIWESLKVPGGGALAIAAGIALVALGTAAKAALSNVASGKGNYSLGSSTSSYGSGSYGSSSSPVRSAPQTIYITGEFRQRGTDLVAVIDKNTQRRVIGT
ncbi:MAG TPA: hypothetical protein PKH68_01360 [Paludibacteraceae bacterium]|nr:hypothetical protein [Paludibacteraceae bacterium]